jgi:hypothetical protein
MKSTFASKTFAPWSFRCATITGPILLNRYRVAEAQTGASGAAAGQYFHPGTDIGQDGHSGATLGQCHG